MRAPGRGCRRSPGGAGRGPRRGAQPDRPPVTGRGAADTLAVRGSGLPTSLSRRAPEPPVARRFGVANAHGERPAVAPPGGRCAGSRARLRPSVGPACGQDAPPSRPALLARSPAFPGHAFSAQVGAVVFPVHVSFRSGHTSNPAETKRHRVLGRFAPQQWGCFSPRRLRRVAAPCGSQTRGRVGPKHAALGTTPGDVRPRGCAPPRRQGWGDAGALVPASAPRGVRRGGALSASGAVDSSVRRAGGTARASHDRAARAPCAGAKGRSAGVQSLQRSPGAQGTHPRQTGRSCASGEPRGCASLQAGSPCIGPAQASHPPDRPTGRPAFGA